VNTKPFCASSPEARLLSDADFWASVYPQDHFARDEPDPDDCPDFTTTQCIRCGCGIRVESWEEAIDRQDESFCDDCADEMTDEPENVEEPT